MDLMFEDDVAPVYRRGTTEPNPFIDVVNAMPIVGDQDGQVKPGTPGSAKSFLVDGGPETRGEAQNVELTRMIRKLTEAANLRAGGAVTVRKHVTVNTKPVKSGPNATPGNVKVVFYLVEKIKRTQTSVESTPATT